jgi:hypothetical protein
MPVKLKAIHDNFHELGSDIRIERGPELKKAIASEKTLSDEVTHPQYHLPAKVKMPNGQVQEIVARDSLGNEIRPGKEFHYLDWLVPTDERGWYVYKRETENPRFVFANHDEKGQPQGDMIPDENDWREQGYFKTFEEAVEAAKALLGDKDDKSDK